MNTKTELISILLVDSQPQFRQGVRFRKLGATSRTQAIVQALKSGLVCP